MSIKTKISNFFLKILEVIITIIVEGIYRLILIPKAIKNLIRGINSVIVNPGLLTLIIGILFSLISLISFIILDKFNLVLKIILLIGVLAFVVNYILNFKKIRNFFNFRNARLQTNFLITTIIFLGILILINFIASRNIYQLRLDWTNSKYFTLSPQTKKIVKDLKNNLKIIAFFSNRDPRKEVAYGVLREYENLSSKIKLKFIDPDINLQKAIEHKIKEYGTIVFQCNDKEERITSWGEQEITSTILKITKAKESKKIYFLTGHGELDIEDTSFNGLSRVKELLLTEQYKVEKLNLFAQGKKEEKISVPANCSILVIVNPEKEFTDEEIKIINEYLQKGGKAFFLVDTTTNPSFIEFLKQYNINVGDEYIIVDPVECYWSTITNLTIKQYEFHQITKEIKEGRDPYLIIPGAKSIEVRSFPDRNITSSELCKSSENSWAEKNKDKVEFDMNIDRKGPLSLAWVLEKEVGKQEKKSESEEEKKIKMRIVIIGDSNFVNNNCVDLFYNKDMFVNAVDWLAEEEELISIRAKSLDTSQIELTKNKRKLIFYTTVIIIPFIILVWGCIVAWKRK